MKIKILRDALILIVVFIAIWLIASRFFNSVSPPSTFLSETQREKLSEWIKGQIEKEYKVMEEHPWSESLEEILNRLQSELGDSDNKYEIVVLDNTTINAFASIGNRVYVFKGLLQLAESPGEAASVIAHEIAHIHLNHVEKKLITEFGLSVLMAVFSGGDVLVAGEIMRTLSSGAFSRKQEGEADDFALKIMHDSGIDPAYLGIMFRRIKEAHPAGIDISFEMFQSHPDINKRIKKSLEYSKDAFSEVPFAIEWPAGPVEEG
jgi:beta-barrel assembly-enhancing protease